VFDDGRVVLRYNWTYSPLLLRQEKDCERLEFRNERKSAVSSPPIDHIFWSTKLFWSGFERGRDRIRLRHDLPGYSFDPPARTFSYEFLNAADILSVSIETEVMSRFAPHALTKLVILGAWLLTAMPARGAMGG
jgi:hypothetical protein